MRAMPGTAAVRAQQLGEVPVAVAVGVDGLAEEHDLAHAAGGQARAPASTSAGPGRLRSRPRTYGHDAEGAEAVAAAHRP